jgi:hypothetical protein
VCVCVCVFTHIQHGTPKYVKQILTALGGGVESNTIIIEDHIILL